MKKVSLVNWTSEEIHVTSTIKASSQVDHFFEQNGHGSQVGQLEKSWFVVVLVYHCGSEGFNYLYL